MEGFDSFYTGPGMDNSGVTRVGFDCNGKPTRHKIPDIDFKNLSGAAAEAKYKDLYAVGPATGTDVAAYKDAFEWYWTGGPVTEAGKPMRGTTFYRFPYNQVFNDDKAKNGWTPLGGLPASGAVPNECNELVSGYCKPDPGIVARQIPNSTAFESQYTNWNRSYEPNNSSTAYAEAVMQLGYSSTPNWNDLPIRHTPGGKSYTVEFSEGQGDELGGTYIPPSSEHTEPLPITLQIRHVKDTLGGLVELADPTLAPSTGLSGHDFIATDGPGKIDLTGYSFYRAETPSIAYAPGEAQTITYWYHKSDCATRLTFGLRASPASGTIGSPIYTMQVLDIPPDYGQVRVVTLQYPKTLTPTTSQMDSYGNLVTTVSGDMVTSEWTVKKPEEFSYTTLVQSLQKMKFSADTNAGSTVSKSFKLTLSDFAGAYGSPIEAKAAMPQPLWVYHLPLGASIQDIPAESPFKVPTWYGGFLDDAFPYEKLDEVSPPDGWMAVKLQLNGVDVASPNYPALRIRNTTDTLAYYYAPTAGYDASFVMGDAHPEATNPFPHGTIVQYNDSLPQPSDARDSGYRMAGWCTNPQPAGNTGLTGCTPFDFATKWQSANTLYAWWDTAQPIALTFGRGVGVSQVVAGTMPLDTVVPYDSYFSFDPSSPPLREGFEFAGWRSGNQQVCSTEEVVQHANGCVAATRLGGEGAFAVNATWTERSDPLTVVFHGNPPEGSSVVGQTMPPDQSVLFSGLASDPATAPGYVTPVAYGHEFAGWFDGPDQSAKPFDFSTTRLSETTTTIYAHWKAAGPFAVEFVAGSPTDHPAVPDSMPTDFASVRYGETIPDSINQPIVPGYEFAGWFTRQVGGERFILGDAGTRVTENLRLFGQWIQVPQTIEVRFDARPPSGKSVIVGTMPETESGIDYNGTVPAGLSTPIVEGYRFTGWNTAADGKGSALAPGITRLVWSTNSSPQPVTWYGTWQAETADLTVKFDPAPPSGATTVQQTGASQVTSVVYNTLLAPGAVPVPMVEGYRFDGWQVVYTSGAATLFDPSTDRLGIEKFNASGSRVIQLRGIWTAESAFNLTFDANLPAGAGRPTVVGMPSNLAGQTYNALVVPGPTKPPFAIGYADTGYQFAGWYTDPEQGEKFVFGTGGSRLLQSTLYAHWTADPNTYSVTWKANDATAPQAVNAPTNNQGLLYGTALAPPDTQIIRPGYKFTGWYTDSATSAGSKVEFTGDNALRITGNTNLYAGWTADATAYKIKFDANAANDPNVTGVPSEVSRKTSEVIGGPDKQILRLGYRFTGWWYQCGSGGTGCSDEFDPTDRVPDPGVNITLKAGWELDNGTYQAVFDANTGGGVTPGSSMAPFNVPTTKTGLRVSDQIGEPDKQIGWPGHQFTGWWHDCTGSTCTNQFDPADRIPDPGQDVTLLAGWQTDMARYRVIYNSGTEGDPTLRSMPTNNQNLLVSEMTAPPNSIPHRQGYRFSGWTVPCEPNSSARCDALIGQVRVPDPGADIEVLAQWEQLGPFQVTFNPGAPANTQVAEMPEPIAPVAYDDVLPTGLNQPIAWSNDGTAGYRFEGWFDSSDTQYLPGVSRIVQATDLYAHWKQPAETVQLRFTPEAPDAQNPLVTGTMPADQTVGYSAPMPAGVAQPRAVGHRFTGWQDAGSGIEYVPGTTRLFKDTVLVPKWTVAGLVPVVFDLAPPAGTPIPGTFPADRSLALNKPLPAGLPVPELVGYQFDSWYDVGAQTKHTPGTDLVWTPTEGTQFVLQAKWVKTEPFAITFDCQSGLPQGAALIDGTCPSAIPGLEFNQLMPEVSTSPRTIGYGFAGWFTAASGGSAVVPGKTQLKSGATVFAQYRSASSVRIQFSAGTEQGKVVEGTMPIEILNHAYDAVLPADTRVPIVPGKQFQGWYPQPDGSGIQYLPGQTRINENTTLHAVWVARPDVTVTYVSKSVTPVEGTMPSAPWSLQYNDLVAKPSKAPLAIGYEFAAWQYGGQDFDFDSARVTASIELDARWTKRSNVAVSFDANQPSGTQVVSGTVPSALTVEFDSLMRTDLSSPVAPGFKWVGWYTAPTGGSQIVPGLSRMNQPEMKLYARWEQMPGVHVEFDINKPDGSTVEPGTAPSPQTVAYQGLVARPSDPVIPGYRFDGWYDASSERFAFATARVTEELVLAARWAAMPDVDVEFDMSGRTAYAGAPSTLTKVAYSSPIHQPTSPEAVGYDFTGWSADADCQGAMVDFVTWRVPASGNGKVTLYACWQTLGDVTVQFTPNEPNAEAGTAENMPGGIGGVKVHSTLDEPAEKPTLAEYWFSYWSTDPAGNHPFIFQGDRISYSGLQLFANWTAKEYFTVTYRPNTPAGSTMHPTEFPDPVQVRDAEMAIQPPDPVATGAVFAGWSSQADSLVKFNFTSTPITENIQVFAIWTTKAPITISFNAAGVDTVPGTMPPAYTDVVYRTKVPMPFLRPVDVTGDKVFVNWCIRVPLGQNETFDFDKLVMSDVPIELFAVWEPAVRYDVEFDLGLDPDGKTGPAAVFQGDNPAAQSVPDGRTARIPGVEPAAEGWRFTGWYTDVSSGLPYSFDATEVKTDRTIHAGWEKMPAIPVAFIAGTPDNATPIPGTFPPTTTIAYNSFVPEPSSYEPGLESHKFAGWRTDPSGATAFAFEGQEGAVRHRAAVSVFAIWEHQADIGVSFDPGVMVGSAAQIVPGTMPTQPTSLAFDALVPQDLVSPAGIGHLFTGWRDADGPIVPGVSRLRTDTTLTAQWDPAVTTVRVEFAPGIGEATGLPDPIDVPVNQTLDMVASAKLVSPGHRFEGWSATARGTLIEPTTFRATGSGPITLHGQWTEMTDPVITFNSNPPAGTSVIDGTDLPDLPVIYSKPVPPPQAVPKVEGWVFTGWYTTPDAATKFAFAGDADPMLVTSSFSLYAGWEEGQAITVSFDTGTIDGQPAQLAEDSPWPQTIPDHVYDTVLPADTVVPRVLGNRFTGWISSIDGQPVTPGVTRIEQSLTLIAQWEQAATEVTVVFDAGSVGFADDLPADQPVQVSGLLDLALVGSPASPGYQFLGWAFTPTGDVLDLATTRIEPAGNTMTLFARWEQRGPVTINLDPGSVQVVSGLPNNNTLTVAYNGRLSLPRLVAVGSQLDGWIPCQDTSAGGAPDPGTSPGPTYQRRFDQNTNMCAVWTRSNSVEVTLNFGGNADPRTFEVPHNSLVSQPNDPAWNGYTFAGWYTDLRFKRPFDFDNMRITEPTTIYVKWVAISGGTGADGAPPIDTGGGGSSDGGYAPSGDGSGGGSGGGTSRDGGSGGGGTPGGGGSGGGETPGGGGTPGGGSGGGSAPSTDNPASGGGNTPGTGPTNPSQDGGSGSTQGPGQADKPAGTAPGGQVSGKAVTAITIQAPTAVWQVPAEGSATLNLTAQITPADATTPGVTWSVISGPASVDQAGQVTSTGPEGQVVVQAAATDGTGVSATIAVQAVRGVALLRTEANTVYLQSGKNARLAVVAYDAAKPTQSTDATLAFTSSDQSVASVDQSGRVRAGKVTKRSTATIQVQAGNGKHMSVKVVVEPKATKLSSLQVKLSKKSLKVGQAVKLKVTLKPRDATGATVTFKSSKPSVLRVDKAGLVVAMKKGKARITVKAAGKQAKTAVITVR
ncbi:MAG: InlB B-repeat-containing protein [Bifidobacteriaceae bacterium]|jgi:uncharacterized repeat protein (TIGR02543 family)|nr:InlB B-repeat-containing protein [Bifidobacteriaceae bacterium]